MEEYSNKQCENTGSGSGSRPSFLYSSNTQLHGLSVGNHHEPSHITAFHLQSGGSGSYPSIKTEANTFHYPLTTANLIHLTENQHQAAGTPATQIPNNELQSIKAKIFAHPHYSDLLDAYINCQKVGAPPEVVTRLAAARQEFEARQRSTIRSSESCKDPELDQFMEAYYDMLVKYGQELTRPIQEARDFIRNIETQLNMLCDSPLRIFSEGRGEDIDSSEEDQDNNSGGEIEVREIDPKIEDRELKNQLLRKYSGYLSSLKQELSKKKKKGKLPKDARQKLLNWWEMHHKWPYPSESEKVALAESTGLDQKQINNWFINQRKRHWKPSEDMQFMVMDGLHPHNPTLYMDPHSISEAHHYRLGP